MGSFQALGLPPCSSIRTRVNSRICSNIGLLSITSNCTPTESTSAFISFVTFSILDRINSRIYSNIGLLSIAPICTSTESTPAFIFFVASGEE